MISTNNNSSGGIGFMGLLTICFIVLKLVGFVSWSWWWVTCLIWGPIAVVAVIALVFLFLLLFLVKSES
jgi:hypothetical protein